MRTTLALLLALVTLSGCATDPPAAPGVEAIGPDSLSAEQLYPLITRAINNAEEGSSTFRIRSGDDEGRSGHRVVTPSEDGSCTVAWHVGAADTNARHVNHLKRRDDGALVVTRMPNRERDVVTRFDPPLVHAYASLTRAEERSQDVTLLVADFDEPDKVTRRGSSTSTVSYLGGLRTTRNGEGVIALLVRTTLVSTFGPAKVNRTTDRWFIQGEGFIGETYTETVRVFGVVTENRSQETWREDVEPIAYRDDTG